MNEGTAVDLQKELEKRKNKKSIWE